MLPYRPLRGRLAASTANLFGHRIDCLRALDGSLPYHSLPYRPTSYGTADGATGLIEILDSRQSVQNRHAQRVTTPKIPRSEPLVLFAFTSERSHWHDRI